MRQRICSPPLVSSAQSAGQWVSNVSEAGVPPDVAVCRDVSGRVAIRAGMVESVPSGLRGSSLSLAEGGAPCH